MDPLADEAVLALIAQPKWAETINSWEFIPQNLPEEFPIVIKDYFQFFLARYSGTPVKTLQSGQDFFSKEGDIYLGLLGFYLGWFFKSGLS